MKLAVGVVAQACVASQTGRLPDSRVFAFRVSFHALCVTATSSRHLWVARAKGMGKSPSMIGTCGWVGLGTNTCYAHQLSRAMGHQPTFLPTLIPSTLLMPGFHHINPDSLVHLKSYQYRVSITSLAVTR